MTADYRQPLSAAQITDVLTSIIRGELPAEEVARFLRTLAERGETAEEIAAGAALLRQHAVPLPLRNGQALCDTCGTGGDGLGTINISTLTGLVAAAAGVRVAKHGNRAASSRCGSADVMEALGVKLTATPVQVARCVDEAGFGFCFAPAFHPAMKAVAPVRKSLGIRTIFNLIGPLANPAPLAFQLVGVSDARFLRPVAEALVRLKVRRGMVVHGVEGLDEVSTAGPTDVIEVRDGRLTPTRLEPARFGLAASRVEDLRGGDPRQNAEIALELLAGRGSPAMRDALLLNSACAISVAGRADRLEDALALARETLDSQRALALLDRLRELTA